MTNSVVTALQLDQNPLHNQLVLIEENKTSDGSFLLSTILHHQIKNKNKIVLVLFHNSIGHYHAISQKLGYNLLSLQDSNDLIVIDIPRMIASLNSEALFSDKPISLADLFSEIKTDVSELTKSSDVTLIFENVSNLLLMSYELKDVFSFIHNIRILLNEIKNVSVVLLLHNISTSDDYVSLINNLKHVSNPIITLSDLKTGKAIDVTGIFTVKWKEKDFSKWNEQSEYHYQLLDRNIKVFAPGYKNI